jgi:hypothetical protein
MMQPEKVAELATRWLDGERAPVLDAIEAEHSAAEIAHAALAVGTSIGVDGAEQLCRAFEERSELEERERDTIPSRPLFDLGTVPP